MALPAASPSLRLLADQTARVVDGLCQALDGIALLVDDPARRLTRRRYAFHVADWLPAVVAAVRAFIAIVVMELFWIVSEWPNGALAITWTAITVILFGPRNDTAYQSAYAFIVGNTLAAICAAVILFACGVSAAVALSWVRSRPGVTSTLIGARRPDQLQANLAALDLILTDGQIAKLNEASKPTLNFPADINTYLAPMFGFPGTTIDRQTAPALPQLEAGRSRY